MVAFCWIHALAFVRLKTDGQIRQKAGSLFTTWLIPAAAPLVAWAVAVLLANESKIAWGLLALAAVALVASLLAAIADREGFSFIALGIMLLAGVAAIFTAAFPVVLPSTLDPAFDLTIYTASSTPYTLKLMSIVAAFGVPLVLAYQAWSYWVFRKRIREEHIPEVHAVSSIV